MSDPVVVKCRNLVQKLEVWYTEPTIFSTHVICEQGEKQKLLEEGFPDGIDSKWIESIQAGRGKIQAVLKRKRVSQLLDFLLRTPVLLLLAVE